MNIVHVLNAGPDVGGLEIALGNLVQHTEGQKLNNGVIRNHIATLFGAGFIGEYPATAALPITPLNISRFPDGPASGFARLVRLIRRSRPVIVNAWTPRSSLLAGLAGRFAGCPPLIWQFHENSPVSGRKDMSQALLGLPLRLCASLSHRTPDAIVYVADTPRRFHELAGFHGQDKSHVIYNGIDCDRFRPDPEARLSVRRELGLADDTLLVGLVARFDPYKDHGLFLSALGRLKTGNVHAILCGLGKDADNPDLIRMIGNAGVADRVHLFGFRNDMPRLTAAFDVGVSSSWAAEPFVHTEAFCLAIGEALAAGVPCVTTNMSDITEAVARAGHVVDSRDPGDLAAAIDSVLTLSPQERVAMGRRGREEAIRLYGMDAHIRKWLNLYESLAEAG